MVFVVIDGLDASGKSTQALRLYSFLISQRKTVFLRVHPSGDNFFGIKTKQFLYLQGKGANFASALFYMLDVIRSILLYSWQKYDYVVFVRYLMGIAYLPIPWCRIAYCFFVSLVPTSALMFFLDVSPKKAYERIRQTRVKLEMFESYKELERVRYKALFLAHLGSWTIIDANKPVTEVNDEIRRSLCSVT